MEAGYNGADSRLAYLFEHAKEVSFSQSLSAGTAVGTLTIDGEDTVLYAPSGGSASVAYTPIRTSGEAVGTLTINGTGYTVYAPDEAEDISYDPTDSGLTATDVQAAVDEVVSAEKASTSMVRNNITSRLSNLTTAVAEQNLEKYGYKIGDYFIGASGQYYILADMNPFKSSSSQYAVTSTDHIGIVVDSRSTTEWDSSGTVTNYASSTLHAYLKGTVLDNVKSDFITLFGGSTGLEHLIATDKLYPTAFSWNWSSTNEKTEYIAALTEAQIYGCPILSMNEYQQGEGCRILRLFQLYPYTLIFGYSTIWLRSINSSSNACLATSWGIANFSAVSGGVRRAVGLILFY